MNKHTPTPTPGVRAVSINGHGAATVIVSNATGGRLADCYTAPFAAHIVRCVNAHDELVAHQEELVAALRSAVASAQPLPAPLGPPLTEHVDKWPQWVIAARAALAKVEG